MSAGSTTGVPLTPFSPRHTSTPQTCEIRSGVSTADGAPRTETEARIAAIWRELFEAEAIGLDENFFDLGGHSLLLLRAHARLREDLGRDLPVVALLRFPTVRALARHLSGEEAAMSSDVVDRARRQKEALARARNVLGRR